MLRGPLYQEDYRPQFSGHETFPLRYGWLKKTFDAVWKTEDSEENRAVFTGEDAIARFGVGKNMVASMRHWATATGVIKDAETKGRTETTQLGRCLFGPNGLDPYMENPATAWLLHWQLSGRPDNKKTTWFWAFNHYPGITFERETLVKEIGRLVKACGWTPRIPCDHQERRGLLRSHLRDATPIRPSNPRGCPGVAVNRIGANQTNRPARRLPLRAGSQTIAWFRRVLLCRDGFLVPFPHRQYPSL